MLDYLKQLSIWDIAIIVYVIDTECKSIIKKNINKTIVSDMLRLWKKSWVKHFM